MSRFAPIKDALLAALVAVILAAPIMGMVLADNGVLVFAFGRVAWVAAAVFAGRLAFTWVRLQWNPSGRAGGPGTEGVGGMAVGGGGRMAGLAVWPARWGAGVLTRLETRPKTFLASLAAACVALPFLPFASNYLLQILTLALVYVMLGMGLNIVVGLAGLLDLGYVAFYAVGAYSYGLMAGHFGVSFWVMLPLAGALAALAGAMLGFPVLKMHGDYLAIVTLGFGEIIRVLLTNLVSITGGPNGLSVPRPTLFGLEFSADASPGGTTFHQFFGLGYNPAHRYIFMYLLMIAFTALAIWIFHRLREMPIGRAWEALREDETACKALGINHVTTKLSAFTLGAAFGGVGGVVFAAMEGFINPMSFTFMESAIILAIVVLGGMGTIVGVALAAVAVTLLPEALRGFDDYRMLIFGLAMVGVMVWRPGGLWQVRRKVFASPPSVGA